VHTHGISATASDIFQPHAAALGKDDDRNALAVMLADQSVDHFTGVSQGELLEQGVGQNTAPAVEQHHSLCTGTDLIVQVVAGGLGVDFQHAVHQVRTLIHHAFHQTVVV